jgi:hypothetical protein
MLVAGLVIGRIILRIVAVAGNQIRRPNPNELHSLTWHLSLAVIGRAGGRIAGFIYRFVLRAVPRECLEAK